MNNVAYLKNDRNIQYLHSEYLQPKYAHYIGVRPPLNNIINRERERERERTDRQMSAHLYSDVNVILLYLSVIVCTVSSMEASGVRGCLYWGVI